LTFISNFLAAKYQKHLFVFERADLCGFIFRTKVVLVGKFVFLNKKFKRKIKNTEARQNN